MISLSIKQAEASGSFQGIRPSPKGEAISQLLFADDCLITCRASIAYHAALKEVLSARWNWTSLHEIYLGGKTGPTYFDTFSSSWWSSSITHNTWSEVGCCKYGSCDQSTTYQSDLFYPLFPSAIWRMVWAGAGRGGKVSCFYFLQKLTNSDDVLRSEFDWTLKCFVSQRVMIFFWKVVWWRLPASDLLLTPGCHISSDCTCCPRSPKINGAFSMYLCIWYSGVGFTWGSYMQDGLSRWYVESPWLL